MVARLVQVNSGICRPFPIATLLNGYYSNLVSQWRFEDSCFLLFVYGDVHNDAPQSPASAPGTLVYAWNYVMVECIAYTTAVPSYLLWAPASAMTPRFHNGRLSASAFWYTLTLPPFYIHYINTLIQNSSPCKFSGVLLHIHNGANEVAFRVCVGCIALDGSLNC